jgi:hypothetical protein
MVHMVADHVGPGHVSRFTEGEFYIGELDGTMTDRIGACGRTFERDVEARVVKENFRCADGRSG